MEGRSVARMDVLAWFMVVGIAWATGTSPAFFVSSRAEGNGLEMCVVLPILCV